MLAEVVWNAETLGVVLGCGIPIVAIIGMAWCRVARVTSENELKRALAERGMSADEIERVVAAKPRKLPS